jgi:ABC-type uncharacterized transport system ATPase subunit
MSRAAKAAAIALSIAFTGITVANAVAETQWEKNHPRRTQVNDRLKNQDRRINNEVREGEIYGLLGPNGAGKTTTISMISGLLASDSGEVSVAGAPFWSDPQRAKRLMGVVLQEDVCRRGFQESIEASPSDRRKRGDSAGARNREGIDKAIPSNT